MAKTAKKAAANIKSILAIANKQPPGPFQLFVRARVTVPNPGCRATLQKAVPQGINPAILLLKVVVKQLPGFWIQIPVDVDADYVDRRYKGNHKSVTVLYGKQSKSKTIQVVV